MRLCRKVFDEMSQRDVVSVLIMGYKNAARYDDALISFEKMQYDAQSCDNGECVCCLCDFWH